MKTGEKSLPPNVIGRCRGSLSVGIVHLNWLHQKAAFRSVQVKLIWWGETDESAQLKVHQGRQGAVERASFKIQTTPQLLHSYLHNCESLELQFTSLISNLKLGTAIIKLPKDLLAYLAEGNNQEFSLKTGGKVLNFQKSSIGDILVEFCIKWNLVPKMPEILIKTLDSRQNEMKSMTILKEFRKDDDKTSEESQDLLSDTNTANLVVKPSKDVDSNLSEPLLALKILIKYFTISDDSCRSLLQSKDGLEFQIECKVNAHLLKRMKSRQWMQNNHTLLVEFFDLLSYQSDIEHFALNFNILVRQVSPVKALNQFRKIGNCTLDLEGPVNVSIKKLTKKCPIYGNIPKKSEPIGHLAIKFKIIQEARASKVLQGRIINNYSGSLDSETIPEKMIKEVNLLHATNLYNNILLRKDMDDSKSSHCHCDKFLEFVKLQSVNHCPRGCVHGNDQPHQSTYKSTEKSESSSNNNRTGKRLTTSSSSQTSDMGPSIRTHKIPPITNSTPEMLQGLLYIGAIRYDTSIQPRESHDYIKINSPLWSSLTPHIKMTHPPSVFNHLEEFPIVFGEDFLSIVRCHIVELELWQPQTASTPDHLIGIANLPMSRFFAAYNDTPTLSNVLLSTLPIVSVDGWVAVMPPLQNNTIAKLQIIFAAGTHAQIEYLKTARGLSPGNLSECIVNQNKLPVPMSESAPAGDSKQSVGTQTTMRSAEIAPAPVSRSGQEFAAILSNFIGDLASHLPVTAEPAPVQPKKKKKDKSKRQQQVRPTSDLMDVLQRALAQPPPTANMVPSLLRQYHAKQAEPTPIFTSPHFKVLIVVEAALHLPKVPQRINKREKMRQTQRTNTRASRTVVEVEPSAYVTFEAVGNESAKIKSLEGPVHVTNVVASSCNPMWNRRYEVYLPVDLMTNDEKQFILKVWRKVTNASGTAAASTSTHSIEPTPFEDAVIGFTAIDLSVLLKGIPSISGWYNIMMFSGRVNGQVKVSIQPMEDISKYKVAPTEKKNTEPTVEEQLIPILAPLTVDVDDSDADDTNNALNRVLKRKFTELEEISHRLRARLSDVTGDDDGGGGKDDPNFEEEFERDLNTTPLEEDSPSCSESASTSEPVPTSHIGDVLKQHNLEEILNYPELMNNFRAFRAQQAANTLNAADDSLNSSQESRVQMISNALRRTVLDDSGSVDPPDCDRHTPEGRSGQSSGKK